MAQLHRAGARPLNSVLVMRAERWLAASRGGFPNTFPVLCNEEKGCFILLRYAVHSCLPTLQYGSSAFAVRLIRCIKFWDFSRCLL